MNTFVDWVEKRIIQREETKRLILAKDERVDESYVSINRLSSIVLTAFLFIVHHPEFSKESDLKVLKFSRPCSIFPFLSLWSLTLFSSPQLIIKPYVLVFLFYLSYLIFSNE
jgi:hypothetical protein